MPYLADHGFHDMVVLPGSCYVDMALRLERERSKGVAGLDRNVTFHNPIIVSAEDTIVKVDVGDHGNGRVEYTFYEAGVAEPAAKLDIDRNLATASRYDVLSIPTAILFEGGEPQETVIGARPRSHFEAAWAQWLSRSQ